MPELVCAATDPRWHAERRKGITATDIPVILGLASWASPYSLWAEKSGITDPAPDSDQFRLGRELEPYIVQRWMEANAVPGMTSMERSSLFRSENRPWQLATPDRVFIRFENGILYPPLGVLEVKSWADIDRHAWDGGRGPAVPGVLKVKSWADMDRHAWDNDLPPAVRAQILWQMDVMDVARGHWGVLFLPSGEFRSGVIEHDPEWPLGRDVTHTLPGSICGLCSDILMMRSAARDFLNLIETGTPPDVDGSAATLAALRARFTPQEGPAAEISEDLWESWIAAKVFESEAKADAKEAEAKIREIIGTATRIKVDGKIVARRIVSTARNVTFTKDYFRSTGQGS
jgi:putative phage-type endonuclease